jgi:acetolactate synthase I/II/III large subunit
VTTVGQALVAGLAARGVEVVFGIPGVHTVELYRGLAGPALRHVTVRHEQGAGFAADGYARATGKPGVAFVITGPGLTNTITAMAQARADSIPILVISGVNRRASLGKGLGLLHELPDQAAMIAALCPTFRVNTPADLAPVLDAAFAAMLGARPGPVHIEVPTDVMPLPCAIPGPAPAIGHPEPDGALVAAARQRLASAQRPVILAGGGAARHGLAVRALAEGLDAPVVLTTNARGIMHGHPLVVPASPSLDAVRALIAGADQVLALGTEFGPTDYDMYVRGGFPDMSGMIRVDICADQLARHPAAVAVQGDVGEVLGLLGGFATRADGVARAKAARDAALAEITPDFRAQVGLLAVITGAMPDAIVVGDSTQPVYAGNLYHDAPFAGAWFNAATGFGALGFAPGAAVGAAVGSGRRVICLIGDGGLQFSPGELRTAVDQGLPITYIVWNNSGFGEIASAMREVGATVIGCDPTPLKMAPFAAACDLPFVSIGPDPAALRAALMQPIKGPRMIEVVIGERP